MALTLHLHPLSSYCWKVLIALYENGTPFEARMVNLGDPDAKAQFVALWPTAKIPLLEDGGRVVPESSIMIEYVDGRYPSKAPLLPGNADDLLEVRLWDRIFDLYVMGPMQRFVAQQLRPEAERDASAVAASRAELSSAYDLIESKLSGRGWAVGSDFSMADCAAAPALFYAQTIVPFPSGHVKLRRYFEHLMARPSVERAIDEARPYFEYFPLRHALPARFRVVDGDAA